MQLIDYDTRQPWEDFANGIIVRACDDYTGALERLKTPKPDDPKKEKAWIVMKWTMINEIWRINRFFRSEWYAMLTTVDSKYILERLFLEHGNEQIKNWVNNATKNPKERI